MYYNMTNKELLDAYKLGQMKNEHLTALEITIEGA